MYLVVLGVAFLAYASYYVAIFLYESYRLRNFTGPLALPFVGNLYTADAFLPLKYVQKHRKKYGDWFVFWGFSKPMVVCTDPVGVREILSDTKTFIKGPDYTHYFAIPFGQGLVTSNGEKHRIDRNRLGKYFHKSNVMKFLGLMNSHSYKAMREMFGENVQDVTVNFEHFFAHLTLRVFGEFCLHHDFSTDVPLEDVVCKTVSKGSYYVGMCIGIGPPVWDFLPWTKGMKLARASVIKACEPIVEERKRAMAAGEEVPDDPLTAMLLDKLEDVDLWDHLVTAVCAGHDTSAFFGAYMTMLLAQYPEVQDKLRAEIFEVLGDRHDVVEEDLDKLFYMRKVMQEVLRVYPVIPALTRLASKDATIKETGITIPKGIGILMPVIAMHRNADTWENPLQFNPERWAESTVFKNDPKIGYLPFGYGSRTCIGMSLALSEPVVFFCNILRKYKFTPEPGFRPNILAGISLTTSNGIKVRVSSL